jgi:hypothetical protein
MLDLDYLHSRIPAYADYSDEDARHLVDKQVRAYVGEALSVVRERLTPVVGPEQAERLEEVLMQCEFTDQKFVTKMDHAHLTDEDVEHLHVVDHALIEIADRSKSVELESLEGYLAEISDLFARRVKAVFIPAA